MSLLTWILHCLKSSLGENATLIWYLHVPSIFVYAFFFVITIVSICRLLWWFRWTLRITHTSQQYTRHGLVPPESGREVKRHLKHSASQSRCLSTAQVVLLCGHQSSVWEFKFAWCSLWAGSATGWRNGVLNIWCSKVKGSKWNSYQWRQLSHDRIYITRVLSIN